MRTDCFSLCVSSLERPKGQVRQPVGLWSPPSAPPQTLLAQVLPDFHLDAPTPSDRSAMKHELAARFEGDLARFFADEAKSEECAKKRAKVTAAAPAAKLIPNRYFLIALDNALQKGLGYGLIRFLPASLPKPLGRSERRELVRLSDEEVVVGSARHRSVIVDRVTGCRIRQEFPRDPREVPPTLHKALDQGSIGWPASMFLDTAVKLRSTSVEDKWHRLHSDLRDALQSCGCWLNICEKTVLYNASTAPWGGHTFYGVLSGAARQYFSERDESCPLFCLLYPDRPWGHVCSANHGKVSSRRNLYLWVSQTLYRASSVAPHRPSCPTKDICHEKGLECIAMGTKDHQKYVFKLLAACPKFHKKGTKVKLGRWQSWFKATADWKGHRNSALLILMYLGLKKKWFSSLRDLPFVGIPSLDDDYGARSGGKHVRCDSPSALATPAPASASQAPPKLTDRSASSAASSSSAGPMPGKAPAVSAAVAPAVSAADPPAPSEHQPRTVKDSNSELRKVRNQCHNTLHFCCLVLANRFTSQITDSIVVTCRAANEFFDLGITECRTRMGSVHFHVRLCQGGFKNIIGQMFKDIHDPASLHAIKLLPVEEAGCAEAAAVEQDSYLCNMMFSLWMATSASMLLSTMTYSHRLPGLFLSLLAPGEDDRRDALQRLHEYHDRLREAEDRSHIDPWVKQFLFALVWPNLSFVQELLTMLFEVSFEELTDEIRTAIRAYGNTFLSSKVDEDAFNRLRAREGAHQAEQLGRLGRWHVAASSQLLTEYDSNAVQVSAEARHATCHRPPGHCFRNVDAGSFSLGADTLSRIGETGVFPQQSPSAAKLSGPAWLAVCALRSDWAKVKQSWQSLLATPGMLLRCLDEENSGSHCLDGRGAHHNCRRV